MRKLYRAAMEHELRYQLAALIAAAVLVHVCYETWVRPVAAQQLQWRESGAGAAPAMGRAAVIVKDYEQEICLIAMLWALAIMLLKAGTLRYSRRLFAVKGRGGQANFLETRETDIILPEAKDLDRYREILDRAKALGYRATVLYKAAAASLDRFFTTSRVPEATLAMQQICETEAERQETGLSMVRYLIWLIPSVGFIGTVRGIGAALGKAEQAVQGNIGPVTESLGVAFNSTFVALVISVVIMLFLHKLQEAQETLILDTQDFCNDHLLRYMREKIPGA
ncbi:MAG: MotA/TolQ/ExbB proton channel family protein [Gammaproteobacteria bacterium]|nr:MotA/TolQ/ExbB proton channel family protein [Gammaproteobacteria bacterium]